ncbi:hypothetical protein LX36DRAFT_582117 [Colletotrichum falcatum]|nr:hypothetical protein LX36DRAFT_582117 [Colletotrichum falcatum]
MQVIRAGLREAQQLADAASSALRVRGVETSLAFKTWFGTSNASPQFVTKLINQHYGTAYSHLVPPTIPVTLSFEERTKYVVGNGVPQPGLDSLIYLCPPKSGFMSDLCDAEDVARVITVNVKGRRVGPTMLTLCPTFFDNRGFTNAKMVQSYQRDIYKELYSNGFYLLHELQHMPKATYPDPRAIDVVGPQGGTCYSIRCCALLEHDQKIRNAQNYAFFALDAAAYPDAVKPASS